VEKIVLKGRQLVPGKVRGTAIVSRDSLSFWGGVDYETGTVNEQGHDIYGQCFAGKILVCPTGKGSGAGSLRLYDMWLRHVAPVAILNRTADEVMVIGAIISDIPMMDSFDLDPLELIHTGDELEVNTAAGTVEILKRA